MPPSVTTWTRLEPRPRAPSVGSALSARIRDPLWFLTRQWQFGEFQATDAGAPAWVRIAASSGAFFGWRAEGEWAIRPLSPANPLEDAVASEPFTPDLATRVELGQLFERTLIRVGVSSATVGAFRRAYPIPPIPSGPPGMPPTGTRLFAIHVRQRGALNARKVRRALIAAFAANGKMLSTLTRIRVLETNSWWVLDDPGYASRFAIWWDQQENKLSVFADADPELEGDREARRFRELVASRAIDGWAVYRAVRAKLPLLPKGVALTRAQSTAAAKALIAWVVEIYGDTATEDPPAWQPERLEYRLDAFAARPGGGTASFTADPGRTGAFDWYGFDLRQAKTKARAPVTTKALAFSIIPGHVRFRGMPKARWWDFESGTTAFGEIRPDKRDIAKLILIDFMLVHGDDWFVIPIDQPVGSLCSVKTLVVHDVFGVETLVERADAAPGAPGARWTLFSTSVAGQGHVGDFFLLPPSAGSAAQVAPAIEETRFLRDEMANMVWALEETTENGLGEPWPGQERDQARDAARGEAPPVTTADGAPLRYLIRTPVPESWFPFVPVRVADNSDEIRLERVFMQRDYGAFRDVLPVGRILRPTRITPRRPYQIYEEEIPREGLRVSRHPVRTRWIDGSTHLWIARRKVFGTGAGSSGLRFDLAVPVGRRPNEI
jgi:hypothetical protein